MDVIAAIATPPGIGALGVLRVSGGGGLEAARRFLSARGGKWEPRVATLCDARDASGEPLDEALCVFFPGESSPTGEDLVEVSAHGSPLILGRILEAAVAAGARPARPGEFSQRAFLNGRLDLAQAEAVCDLIRARTDAARRAALSQLRGGLSRELAATRAPLFELLVEVEARLDHPDEDLPGVPPARASALVSGAMSALERLAASYAKGRVLSDGARVCLIGRPNAGKSSLLNALLGRERAIVCAQPGTTRDTLEEPAEFSGAPALLIDTAGLRESCVDAAEKIGLERAEAALGSADVALLVIDGSRPEDEEDRRVHARIRAAAGRLIPVVNKADVLDACWERQPDALRVSAKAGTGVRELERELARALGPADDATLVTSARHHDALCRAAGALGAALETLSTPRWEDRFARDVRDALDALGEIDGAVTTEDLLGAVFSRFCVGK